MLRLSSNRTVATPPGPDSRIENPRDAEMGLTNTRAPLYRLPSLHKAATVLSKAPPRSCCTTWGSRCGIEISEGGWVRVRVRVRVRVVTLNLTLTLTPTLTLTLTPEHGVYITTT
jgi:hypothetical protein